MNRLLGKIWCWLFGHRPWEIEIDRGYVGMHRFVENGIGFRPDVVRFWKPSAATMWGWMDVLTALEQAEATIRERDAEIARLRADARSYANVMLSEENDRLIAEMERLSRP